MTEPKIAKCGLHLMSSVEETDESSAAKLALAEKLVAAAPESEECSAWNADNWYGYLSAVMDVKINYTERGAEPTFQSLWELEGQFSDDLRPFDDLYADLAEPDLGESARYAAERMISVKNAEELESLRRRSGEESYRNPEWLALGRPHAKAIADELRKQADILEQIWSDPTAS